MTTETYPVRGDDRPRGWSAGRGVSVVAGVLLMLTAFALGAAGGTLALADRALRDDQGFLMSDEVALTSDSFAIISASLELHTSSAGRLPEVVLGDAKVTATGPSELPVFIGVAGTRDVEEYLREVAHETVTDLTGFDSRPRYERSAGGAPAALPQSLDIWVDSSSGTGPQTIQWPIERGDWTLVLMNSDGSAHVSADVAAGATIPALNWLVAGLLAGAFVLFLVALVLVVVPLRAVARERRARGL